MLSLSRPLVKDCYIIIRLSRLLLQNKIMWATGGNKPGDESRKENVTGERQNKIKLQGHSQGRWSSTTNTLPVALLVQL